MARLMDTHKLERGASAAGVAAAHRAGLARTKIVITATAAVICISGSWGAAPAQATTDATGGGPSTSSVEDFGQVLAVRKMQMAHDYVANAGTRAGLAARVATSGLVCEPPVPTAG